MFINEIGLSYSQIAELDSAIYYSKKVLQQTLNMSDKWDKDPILSLKNLGYNYMLRQAEGDVEKAIKHYTEAIILLEDPDWKVFIEDNMAKDKQLRRKHEALINKLKKPIMKNVEATKYSIILKISM